MKNIKLYFKLHYGTDTSMYVQLSGEDNYANKSCAEHLKMLFRDPIALFMAAAIFASLKTNIQRNTAVVVI